MAYLQWGKPRPGQLEQNLRHAEQVLRFVQRHFPQGPFNGGRRRVSPGEMLALQTMRARVPELEEMAFWALDRGIGCCTELAAVAYVYLRDRTSARPLDMMALAGGGDDHVFVVIGRQTAGSPQDWGPACVVVDPWYLKAYPASSDNISQAMQGCFGPGGYSGKFTAMFVAR